MDFNRGKAIFLQIADHICNGILSGAWQAGGRLPSVRDMAMSLEVNPNTIQRTYGYLQDEGIVANRRGVGLFVSDNAPERIRELKKETFIKEDIPELVKTMQLLGLDMDDIRKLCGNHKGESDEKK